MATVTLVPYSSAWPALFAQVRDELAGVFAPTPVAVEHIGSTAVPGLAAKPVIDVLLGAECLAGIKARIAALAAQGYEYVSRYEDVLPLRRYFVKASADSLRVHVHGVELDGLLWRKHLAFRDALRADPALRSAYQDLKRRLAAEHAQDKAAYTEAKGVFVRAILASAGMTDDE